MASIKNKHGVPRKFEGCHTPIIGGYVFEGIPVKYVKHVLDERKKGIALPGMPVGVPGMPGGRNRPPHVYHIAEQATPALYATF